MNKEKIFKKRIDQILLDRGLVLSKNKAQAIVMAGKVYCNRKLVLKPGHKYDINNKIQIINNDYDWVSRGALKLEPIIIRQQLKIKDKICLDIGSSTGGFSQVLLKYGAKKIFAIDVGYGQIHEKIKNNTKVQSFERTNARYLNDKIINEEVDIIVCDASFISLKKIINKPLDFLKKGGILVALIKPQFEALKNEVKRNGVVQDKLVHERVCEEIKIFFENKKLKVLSIEKSPLIGPKGNIEFFITVSK